MIFINNKPLFHNWVLLLKNILCVLIRRVFFINHKINIEKYKANNMKQNGNKMLEAKNEKLERKCFEQNKVIISLKSEINRLEEYNKQLKLDFNKMLHVSV